MTIYVGLHAVVPRVLVYRFYAPWTAQDLFNAFAREQYYSQLLPNGQTYAVILDLRRVQTVKEGIKRDQIPQIGQNLPPNHGELWVVRNPDTTLPPLFNLGLHENPTVKARTYFADDLKTAITEIQRTRQTASVVS